MTVTVLMFAQARELTGHSEVILQLENGATVAHVRTALLDRFPNLQEILPHCSFAVDQCYATEDHAIREQSEIGCIPPVSGG